MKKIRLYDLYEEWGINLSKSTRIGEYDTIEQAERAAAQHDLDCDGECEIFICRYNEEAKRFLAIDAEPFKYSVGV